MRTEPLRDGKLYLFRDRMPAVRLVSSSREIAARSLRDSQIDWLFDACGTLPGRCLDATWALFGVALRPQPIDAPCAGQPFVNVGFGLEAFDVTVFGAWIFGDNLPVAFGNPFGLENDSG